MKGNERRDALRRILLKMDRPVSGKELAGMLGVSRQVIVQDITLLRTQGEEILSTTTGYILKAEIANSRVFKVVHTDEQTQEELRTIVDLGGCVEDVFVYHKVYGTVKADLHIRSRKDADDFIESFTSGKSSLLKNVTSGYHYHTVTAASQQLLDLIQENLRVKGFLAELQDYEPVDFWSDKK